jgi:hypothetical protein
MPIQNRQHLFFDREDSNQSSNGAMMLPQLIRTFGRITEKNRCSDWVLERMQGINDEILADWIARGEAIPIVATKTSSLSHFWDKDCSDGYGLGSAISNTGENANVGYGSGVGSGLGYGNSYCGQRNPKQITYAKTIKQEHLMPTVGQRIIVRSHDQGSVYGLYQWHSGREVCLHNARQIIEWSGNRLTLFDVATTISTADTLSVSAVVDEILMLEACGIISCSQEATNSIDAIVPTEPPRYGAR